MKLVGDGDRCRFPGSSCGPGLPSRSACCGGRVRPLPSSLSAGASERERAHENPAGEAEPHCDDCERSSAPLACLRW